MCRRVGRQVFRHAIVEVNKEEHYIHNNPPLRKQVIIEHNEGYYIFTTFEALPTFPQQLERLFRISEDVIKFIVVKKDR